MPNDAKGRIDSPVELWKDVSRELWEVQLLGGGTRHMTADELDAALARQEIHPRTPVRKQGTATWMTLREARRFGPAPHANAIAATSRKAPPLPDPKTTSFQPSIEELAVVRPSSALGTIIAFAALALVGGGIVAAMTAKATGPGSEAPATTTSAANGQTPAAATATPEPTLEAAQALAAVDARAPAAAASTAALASPRDDAGTAAPVTRNGAREPSGAPMDAGTSIDAREANGVPTAASADAGVRAANEASTRVRADGGAASGVSTRASADGGAKATAEASAHTTADSRARAANEASTRASVGAANSTSTRASAGGGARGATGAAGRASAGGGARGTSVRVAPRSAAHEHATHATVKLDKKSERAASKRAKASPPKKVAPKKAKPGPRADRNTTKHTAHARAATSATVE